VRDREDLVDELFAEASDIEPSLRAKFFAARRAEYDSLLTEGVFDEVSALLEADDYAQEKGFLQQPLIEDEDEEAQASALINQPLDGYTILRLIARGGMGEVYLARDEELNFDVAIKIVRGGIFGRENLIRRFHAERRILAQLKHPNIAKIFKGGATPDGSPYLVMEYVDGQSILQYADESNLSINARLELFRKVCAAVAYAHSHLVIHRDIKPPNVLVTSEGEPKLLDFGIAKLLDPAHAANETVMGAQAMTPEYASPEQIKGEPVTTATDVYSLGVLLYELLTGHRPYRLKNRRPDEVAQIICTQQPERPSAVVRRLENPLIEDSAPPITLMPESDGAKSDNTPERLRRSLRGDLDNIVLMALRKEPERRYVSVGQFSEDIRRHLEGLPVIACKNTLQYRAQKFVQRNKIGVAAAAFVALTLVVGIVATTWEAHVARQESARAERRFNDVRQLAHSFVFDLNDEVEKGPTKAREMIVKKALAYLNSLAQEAHNDASLQRELAVTYMKVSDIQGRAYAANLGDSTGAMESLHKAVALLEQLMLSDSRNVEDRLEMSKAYEKVGKLQTWSKDYVAALENHRKALVLREALSADDPHNAVYRLLIADSYMRIGDALGVSANLNKDEEQRQQVLETYRKALAIVEGTGTLDTWSNEERGRIGTLSQRIGTLLNLMGEQTGDAEKFRAAIENHRKSLACWEAMSADNPSTIGLHRVAAGERIFIGVSQTNLGDTADALENYKQARGVFENLAASDPNNAEARRDLVFLYISNARTLAKAGQRQAAERNYRQALQIMQALLVTDPVRTIDSYDFLAQIYKGLRELSEQRGAAREALEDYRKELEANEKLLEIAPENKALRAKLIEDYARLGNGYTNPVIKTKTLLGEQRRRLARAAQ